MQQGREEKRMASTPPPPAVQDSPSLSNDSRCGFPSCKNKQIVGSSVLSYRFCAFHQQKWFGNQEHRLPRVFRARTPHGLLSKVARLHEHTEACNKSGSDIKRDVDCGMQLLHARRIEKCKIAAAKYPEPWPDAPQLERRITDSIEKAATDGRLAAIQRLHLNRNETCTAKAMDGAARNGHLDVVKWLHVNRREGCTEEAMDGAAQHGHLDVVKWLHANRTEGCTTKAMDGAARRGFLNVVKWLHEHRSEGCTSDAFHKAAWFGAWRTVEWLIRNRHERCPVSILTDAIAYNELRVFQALYEREELKSWPRLIHASILVNLVSSDKKAQWTILKHIVSTRRLRYNSEAADNPVYLDDPDLASKEKDAAMSSALSEANVDDQANRFSFTVVNKLSKEWDLPGETSKHISEFILEDPSLCVDRVEAVKRGWIHWLASFSTIRNGDIDLATRFGNLHGARMMHNRLQAEGRLNCSKRFMYLTVERGEISFVHWHVNNCEVHSFEDWVYAAVWIGREDVVDWLHDNIANLQHLRRESAVRTARLKPSLLLTCPSASFSSVAERFESELMEVENDMSEVETAARDGVLDRVKLFVQPKQERVSLEDRLETRISGNALNLAAIHGHLHIVRYLHQNDRARASVSGLYGAIVRGHLDIVRYLYDVQPELVSWPPIDDGPQVLRIFLTPINREMLHYFRQERNMRLTARDLRDAVLRGDLASVRMFPELDLVDWNDVTACVADLAAARGDYRMLRALCRARHCFSTRAIDGAAECGHLRIVKFLDEAGAPCTRRAVDLAALNGHEDVVRFLMEKRHEGCSPYALFWACVNGHEGVVRYLTSKQAPCDVDMCVAAARSEGYETIVRILREYGILSGLAHTTRCSSRLSVRQRQRAEANTGVFLPSTGVVIQEIYKLLGVAMPTSNVEDLQSSPRKKRRTVVKHNIETS